MVNDWQLSPQQEEILIKAGEISASVRCVADADWELNDTVSVMEPFDPFADDPE